MRLAALLPVLCYHYCIEAARLGFAVPTALIGRGMADWVEVGLAWFFLLSGAALCLQWQGRFDARRYFVGRAAATYPAFWLGFGALFLYGEVLHGNNADIPRWRVIFSVLGLDGYLAPVTVTFYKIGEWFLGVILILYLVFPLLLRCMDDVDRVRALAQCAVRVEVMLRQHGLQLLGKVMPRGEELQIIALFGVCHRAAAQKRRGDERLHTVLAFEVFRADAQGRLLAGVAKERQHFGDLVRVLHAELIHGAGGALLADDRPLHAAAAVELLGKMGHALIFGLQNNAAVIKVFAKTGHRIRGGHVAAGL